MLNSKNKLFLSFLFVISFSSTSWCGNIVYPWNATTDIVVAGENITIWFDADAGQTVTSVELLGPYNTVLIPSVSTVSGSWIYDEVSGNVYNKQITVTVPVNAPADRYDLILNTSSGQEVSLRSVMVVREYKNEYTIMHISDTHLGQGDKINGHPPVLFKISTLAEIANIIGPEMVFNTGDVIHARHFTTQERTDFYYKGHAPAGLKGMHGFDAATFSAIGNHDFLQQVQEYDCCYPDKSNLWNDYHGLQYHHFKYGNTRCMVVNNGWDGFDWGYQLSDHTSWLSSAGSGNLRIAAYHKSESGTMGNWANNIDLGLAMIGHNHHLAPDNPYELDGRLIQYYANSVREYINFNLYRVDANGNYTVVNNTSAVENPNDDPALWRPKLTLDYMNANDGTLSSNSATIVNKFDASFPRVKVRFLMAKGASYIVTEGTIEQEFDGDLFHIVDVRVPLEANSTTDVEITAIEKLDHNLIAHKQNSKLENIPPFTTGHSPELVVWNLGSSEELNVPVHCEISSDGEIVYSDIKTIDKIEPNEVDTITFDSWNATESNTYDLKFFTVLDNDQDKSSDTLKSNIVVNDLLEDFETGFENWVTDASWGTDNRKAYSGEFSMSVNAGPRYDHNTNSYSMLNYSFDLTSVNNPDLTFWSQTVLASGDSGFVEISIDEGITWEQLGDAHSGLNTEWKYNQYSLKDYKEYNDVRIRFHFVSDGEKNHLGWFIDDVKIENTITSIDDKKTGSTIEGYRLFNNYPNPFNPSTTIGYSIPKSGFVQLKVYDVLGNEVATLVNEEKSSGVYKVEFNALSTNRRITSGIYFYKIQSGTFIETKKLVLLK